MDNQLKYQILKLIAHNGNILELSKLGYEFGQITFFIETLKNEEQYIMYDSNNIMVVSPDGKTFIREFEKEQNIRSYSKWILPRSEMWDKPIDRFAVYIPKR